jgi:hypothetical protein
MTRFGYILVMVALLGWAGSLLLKIAPGLHEGSPSVDLCSILIGIVVLSASIAGSWQALTLSVLLALLLVSCLDRWRYLLVVMTLASWLAVHLLNYVSRIAVWPIGLFKVCWLALFFLALAAPFRRRWRDLAIACLVLFNTLGAFVLTSVVPEPVVLPNRWLQETGFRIYALHLIRSTPPDEFLSRCKLVEYTEEDGATQQVGECSEGLRSTVWFRLLVIYDPSGQSAWPAIQRTLAWRLAVLHLPEGRSFVHEDDTTHLVGNFYWFLDSSPDRGDDGRVRPD